LNELFNHYRSSTKIIFYIVIIIVTLIVAVQKVFLDSPFTKICKAKFISQRKFKTSQWGKTS